MQPRLVILGLALCCAACNELIPPIPTRTPDPADRPERAAVVTWATEMAKILNATDDLYADTDPIDERLAVRQATQADYDAYLKLTDRAGELYSQVIHLSAPAEVSEVHELFADAYDRLADGYRLYSLSLLDGDTDAYNDSIDAYQEAERFSSKAYDGFVEILNTYEIHCRIIDYCDSVVTATP